jgi:molybdopterin-guanine dinucleotide biosynthesis protein A
MTGAPARPPVGAVLAGGRGRRFGSTSKPAVKLLGRPLIEYPLDAIGAVLPDPPVVVAKPDTPLPPLPAAVEVWHEPPEPRHPLTGIVYALQRADGRSVFVCAADMPLLDAEEVAAIVGADPGDSPAVVPRLDDRLQPLCALYTPAALPALDAALERVRAAREAAPALTTIVEALAPHVLERGRAEPYLNVNAPADLGRADAALRARSER